MAIDFVAHAQMSIVRHRATERLASSEMSRSAGPKLVWEMKKGTSYSSPAISGDRLLFIHRIGREERVECLHRETGERYWSFTYPTQFEDRYGYNNGPRASPVIDGDRVYTYGAEGKLHCLKLETGQVYWKRDIPGEFRVPQDFLESPRPR